uniref:TNF receptor-associated factor 3-like n=1 Tax=Styela clava TaxID=7725 RepID=UPI00193A431F|nr:TNF receptor-associated factor 3-like [Styela clava]
MGVDLACVKTTMENLMSQVEEIRHSGRGGGGSANINLPENLNEMFEALKRQLVTYEVRLAEMDFRFQSEERDASHVSLTGPMPPLSDSSEIGNFENEEQYQFVQLRRWVQELHNDQTITANQRNQVYTIITNLQRIVSMEANENATTRAQVRAMKTDTDAIKTAVVTLMRQSEERTRVAQGGEVANPSVPDNLNEMFQALERQLGTYAVNLAEMDLRFQALETTNCDGKLVWKIRDFERHRDDAKRIRALSIYSQPFYTSPHGYKMCLRVYLNGDGMGKNTHISLFFILMKGEHDELLSFPFRQKVTLMLLDQGPDQQHLLDVFRPDPTSSSFKKPTSDMNMASGFPKFVAQDDINGSSYVKNDTIVIRVEVDTTA